MAKQFMKEQRAAIYALITKTTLTNIEVTNLTLGDLHLASKEPSLSIWDDATETRRTVYLESEVRDAIVAWMLARPDRPTALLFPNDKDEAFTPAEITALSADYEKNAPQTDSKADSVKESAPTDTIDKLPKSPPFQVTAPQQGPEQMKILASTSEVSQKEASSNMPQEEVPQDTKSEEEDTSKGEVETKLVSLTPSSSLQSEAKMLPKSRLVLSRLGLLLSGGVLLLSCSSLMVVGRFLLIPIFDGLPIADTSGGNLTSNPASAVITQSIKIETLPDIPSPTMTPKTAPTLTSTATLRLSPTPLPSPTTTMTSTAIPEPTATSTETPSPSATPSPSPTSTPISLPPPPTNTPEPSPTQIEATATLGLSYAAPQLLTPEPKAQFIPGNTIDLVWEPVAELADNEHYAVRLLYQYQGETQYKGTQLRETLWTIPLDLDPKADGPDFRYEWYVYIEAIQVDGSTIPVSPESERREFIWKLR